MDLIIVESNKKMQYISNKITILNSISVFNTTICNSIHIHTSIYMCRPLTLFSNFETASQHNKSQYSKGVAS
jgi:hypothetical protein